MVFRSPQPSKLGQQSGYTSKQGQVSDLPLSLLWSAPSSADQCLCSGGDTECRARAGPIGALLHKLPKAPQATCGIVGDEEDWAYLQNNPAFDLRGCSYVLDPRNIAANDNMVAINAALMVDLTGQIASESIGSTMLSGTRGLLEVVIGALWSRGGRSITVLLATSGEGSSSRIVPLLPEGTVVSVPRLLADIVVTEHGVARLLGKTMRERAEELIAIAHPDFRADLKTAAQRLLYP